MKVILVDDEPLALNYLESILKKTSNLVAIHKFTHLDINKEFKIITEIDIAFLDIEMPGKNGLTLAEEILLINPDVHIVFVSGHSHYAIHAFDIEAFDFILKPVQLDRVQLTMKRIYQNSNKKNAEPLLSNQLLQIRLFGNLAFQFNGKTEVIKWRTTKVQELFLYLLHHDKKFIHKSKLIELLWPEIEHAKAYARLYNTIYLLRNNLYKFNQHFYLKNVADGYMFTTKNVLIDTVKWKNKITSTTPINDKNVANYEDMMSLYTEPYLVELDYLWLVPERRHLEQLWLKTAYELIDFYNDIGDLHKIESWYSKICSFFPEDENAHFALMKLYAKSKQSILVDYLYAQLQSFSVDENTEFNSNIKNWYKQWKYKKVDLLT